MEVRRKPFIPENADLNQMAKEVSNNQPSDVKTTNNDVVMAKLLESIRMAKIDPFERIERPPVCLSMKTDNGDGIIATLGNISLIIGKAKSKKTFSVSLFLATLVNNGMAFGKFEGELPAEKNRVIFFDTEQSKYHVQKFYKRVCLLLGIQHPKNFDCYCLRSYTTEERLSIIDEVINTTPDLGFVAIDGVRDLVTSINDEFEATKIATYLLRWSEIHQIHIMTVLHQNKGDNNARGHVGTELVNKSETVLSVTVDGESRNTSFVEPEFCRDREPDVFAFTIDENGLPRLVDGWTAPQSSKRENQKKPDEIFDTDHIQFLNEAFSKLPDPKGSELLDMIKTKFDVGNSKANQFRTYYLTEKWIIRKGKANAPNGTYSLNTSQIT